MLGCGAGSTTTSEPEPPEPEQSVASIGLSPDSLLLLPGETVQLQADVRDERGHAMPGVTLAWSTNASAIATVTTSGLVTALSAGTATVQASGGGESASTTITVRNVYDLDRLGAPVIVNADYIELAKVSRFSRFRSGIGHDYSDDVENCRSMKHYFQPHAGIDWGTVVIRSPIDGTVQQVLDEHTFGKQVRLVPTSTPAATVIIFHVNTDPGVVAGTPVAAGARLGTHISSATMSDIAIWLETPSGRRLVSYFDVMTDAVFTAYQAWGLPSRGEALILQSERDASQLSCTGEAFANPGTVSNWIERPVPGGS